MVLRDCWRGATQWSVTTRGTLEILLIIALLAVTSSARRKESNSPLGSVVRIPEIKFYRFTILALLKCLLSSRNKSQLDRSSCLIRLWFDLHDRTASNDSRPPPIERRKRYEALVKQKHGLKNSLAAIDPHSLHFSPPSNSILILTGRLLERSRGQMIDEVRIYDAESWLEHAIIPRWDDSNA